MLRPRSGDFLYSDLEIEVILADLAALKAAGAAGFVFGALLADGTVDEALLKRVVAAAWPRPVTFHRALDVAADPLAALGRCPAAAENLLAMLDELSAPMAEYKGIGDPGTREGVRRLLQSLAAPS